ncbi:MAG: hypothetical protein QOF77_79 [Solirubrobacteraceae bacterium]|nr:hypothetical protein [Solirubrobacteraceae bacterium]
MRTCGGRVTLGLCLALLIAGCGAGGKSKSPGTITSPVSGEARDVGGNEGLSALIVSPVDPAVPFRGSNGAYLVSYELRVFNPTPLTLVPTRLSVATPGGQVIERLNRAQVTAALALPGARSGVRELHEGQLTTLYLTLEFTDHSKIPDRLVHRLTVRAGQLPGGRFVSAATSVRVLNSFVVPVLGPPLAAGRRYVAADSCCSSVRHRRALLPIGNRLWLAQRFAVDWEQLDDTGRFVKRGGDPANNADYTIYGDRVIAAADATVVHVVDGLPAQKPGTLPSGLLPHETDGNTSWPSSTTVSTCSTGTCRPDRSGSRRARGSRAASRWGGWATAGTPVLRTCTST